MFALCRACLRAAVGWLLATSCRAPRAMRITGSSARRRNLESTPHTVSPGAGERHFERSSWTREVAARLRQDNIYAPTEHLAFIEAGARKERGFIRLTSLV